MIIFHDIESLKSKRGGPNRGQGRKPITPGEGSVTVQTRMSRDQAEKLKKLGGAKWVRGKIDADKTNQRGGDEHP